MKIPLLVIGGGLSGLAAAIRAARFIPDVHLVEQHSRLGGLNSYYYRGQHLFETGLHAITNYADPKDKKAPLNRLFRQLKLKRSALPICQQYTSEIVFNNRHSLVFSNNIELLQNEVANSFPACKNEFAELITFLGQYDAFAPSAFVSARSFLEKHLNNQLLVDMLLCPLMFYGSSHQNDMDLSQFAIMFQAIFVEGMFRPAGTIKDLLDLLEKQYHDLGGNLRLHCGVRKLLIENKDTIRVLFNDGDEIECAYVLSTIGKDETLRLIDSANGTTISTPPRLAFVETIFQLKENDNCHHLPTDKTIVFYNDTDRFSYRVPPSTVDASSGVICLPTNFNNLPIRRNREIRTTHLANHELWRGLQKDSDSYRQEKARVAAISREKVESIIGSFSSNIVYEDTFSPLTIERYTGKIGGAIYGTPDKVKDGRTAYPNLFLAGTDQGFLGIVGSMLSGVSIVNQHILAKL